MQKLAALQVLSEAGHARVTSRIRCFAELRSLRVPSGRLAHQVGRSVNPRKCFLAASRRLSRPVGHMAEFLWLKHGDQAPICQQTDKLGRLHIPSVAVTFSSDPQSIRLDGIGFNWDRDAKSPAYGYTDNNILKQIPDKGRTKAQPIVVDATSVAGAAGTERDASIHVVDAEVEMVDAETDGVPVERFKVPRNQHGKLCVDSIKEYLAGSGQVLKSIGDGYPACKEGWSLNSYTATPIQLRVGPKPVDDEGYKLKDLKLRRAAFVLAACCGIVWVVYSVVYGHLSGNPPTG
ncbi:hypothetical protein WJX77_005043 [Trebouxia sp. C0004]